MAKSDSYKDDLRLVKSVSIISNLQKRADRKAFEDIKSYSRELTWKPLAELSIDSSVWNYIVKEKKYNPAYIFCHPDLILDNPKTILYYRGICGLSLKASKDYFGSIENLEKGSPNAKLNISKAKKIAKTFNTFICEIIKKLNSWTLDNGKRTVIATIGITLDGSNRGRVGKIAEKIIKNIIVDWLIENNLIIEPYLTKKEIIKEIPSYIILKDNVEMKFGSEPDISFSKGKDLLAVIEIKGGIDPAGALERYGAATKSFEHAINKSKRCKNFYLCGIFTSELLKRIDETRLIEESFDIIKIVNDQEEREKFFKELFHHTLRLI